MYIFFTPLLTSTLGVLFALQSIITAGKIWSVSVGIARHKQKENLDFSKKKKTNGPTCWEMSNDARYFPFFLILVLVIATLYICYFSQMRPHSKKKHQSKNTSMPKHSYLKILNRNLDLGKNWFFECNQDIYFFRFSQIEQIMWLIELSISQFDSKLHTV